MPDKIQSKKAIVAAVLMDVGLGGFVDGILLHQIFQWHNMVSNWYPPTGHSWRLAASFLSSSDGY